MTDAAAIARPTVAERSPAPARRSAATRSPRSTACWRSAWSPASSSCRCSRPRSAASRASANFASTPSACRRSGSGRTMGHPGPRTAIVAAGATFAWGANLARSPHKYWQFLGNSLVIGRLTVFLTLAVAAPAAFAFAHLKFFGDRFLFNYLILGLTFPFATAILPLFIKIRDLGLLDTHWGIVLPQVAFGLAISVLLLRNAFRQLPVRAGRIGADGRLRLQPHLLLDHPAAVAADPVDGGDHRLRHQLEQLPAAAGRPQHDAEIPVADRPHGVPGRVHDATGSWCSPSSRSPSCRRSWCSCSRSATSSPA